MFSGQPMDRERQRQLARIEKRIQSLHNEMEFVEILAQFWPWPNMVLKVERLQSEIARLRHQSSRLALARAS
jgi:hypothetical protein